MASNKLTRAAENKALTLLGWNRKGWPPSAQGNGTSYARCVLQAHAGGSTEPYRLWGMHNKSWMASLSQDMRRIHPGSWSSQHGPGTSRTQEPVKNAESLVPPWPAESEHPRTGSRKLFTKLSRQFVDTNNSRTEDLGHFSWFPDW